MSKVIASITLYHPNPKILLDLIDKLSTSEVDIFITDNANIAPELKAEFLKRQCLYQQNPENIGLAAAQNIAINHAIQHNYDFIWLFDQDSQISPKLLTQLLTDYQDLINQGKAVAAIGPSIIDPRFNHNQHRKKLTPSIQRRRMIIASGSLIPINIIKKIGPMHAQLFMDFIDTEWCYRAHKQGYNVYQSTQALMLHHLGEIKPIFFGLYKLRYMSPARYYYFTCNLKHLTLEHRISRISSISGFLRHLPLMLIKSLFLKGTKQYFIKVYQGLKS